MALEKPPSSTGVDTSTPIEKGSRSPEKPRLSDKMLAYAEEMRAKGLLEEADAMSAFATETAAIEQESRTDELTSLFNRRGFAE